MSSMPTSGPVAASWPLRVLGLVLLAAGFYMSNARVLSLWLPAIGWENGGVDFVVLHAMARGIAQGVNVYELNDPGEVGAGVVGMVYPPATGFAVLPLALLSMPAARAVFFVLVNLVLVLGVRALVRHFAPGRGAHVWMIAAALAYMAAATRWGMMLLQTAPLMLGLLCFFLVAVDRGHWRTATAIAMLATAFKMTLALPFLGLLLLHRRLPGLVLAGGSWVVLNGLGFLRMGSDAFATYRANVAQFEVLAPWNINGPDPWLAVSLPRLDWVFLFFGILRDVPLSRLANLACAGLTALWLLREGWRLRRQPVTFEVTCLFLTPLVCLGSLAVYHHQYDAVLFLAPILLAWLLAPRLLQPRWAALLAVPLLFIVLLLPIGLAQNILGSLFGPAGVGLVKISFPSAMTLALIGSLVLLRKNTAASAPPG